MLGCVMRADTTRRSSKPLEGVCKSIRSFSLSLPSNAVLRVFEDDPFLGKQIADLV